MFEINKIKERLKAVEKKISEHEYTKESLEEEIEDITRQIYKAVDEANEKDRDEIDNLLMFKNVLKTKFLCQWFKGKNHILMLDKNLSNKLVARLR